MAVLIPLIVAGALVALSLADRANRRSRDERAVAASRADLERLGDIVASVRRDVLGRPPATRGGEPAPARDAEHPPRLAAPGPRPLPDHVAARPTVRRRTVAAVGALTVLVAVSLAVVHQTGATRDPSTSPTAPTSSGPPSPTGSTTPTNTTAPPPSSPEVVAPVAADQRGAVFAALRSVSVRLVAHDRCWVGVRNPNGTRGFEGTLEAGDQQEITGSPPLQIRLGSPTAVDMFVNGTPALVPGRPGQPLDLTFLPT
jgi:hypothetical protein